ncbi:MAG: hypothetical protein GY772_06945 [bacterium]|nr:hypothetical protein [bacterium]
MVLACPTNTAGDFVAPELATEQTLERLQAFGERLEVLYERYVSPDRALCPCGSGRGYWWALDGRGIPLCRVCDRCKREKLAQFRPEILRPYAESDVDEDIEPDYGAGEEKWP